MIPLAFIGWGDVAIFVVLVLIFFAIITAVQGYRER